MASPCRCGHRIAFPARKTNTAIHPQSQMRALGAEYIATGHHAIFEHHGDNAILRRGYDPRKDQSYFLFSLRQHQLRRAVTPLGGMTKDEIRAIARKMGLKITDKVDSQEICFVPRND